MVSEAASMPRTLRLCCPPSAWSMRDGMGHMQADVVAIRATQCSAEALTGSLKGYPGTLHGLSLVAAADTCYGSCDAPDGQSVSQAQSLSPRERLQGGGVAQWLLITSVIFLASTLQSMTGFGFAVLAVPLLVPLLPPRDAVALITLLSTATTVLAWWRIRAETAPVAGRVSVMSPCRCCSRIFQ